MGETEGGTKGGREEGRGDSEDWLAGNLLVWERVVGLVHGPKGLSRCLVSLAVAVALLAAGEKEEETWTVWSKNPQ